MLHQWKFSAASKWQDYTVHLADYRRIYYLESEGSNISPYYMLKNDSYGCIIYSTLCKLAVF